MCGIVGALTFDAFEKKSEEKIRTEANIFITTQLLQATVERGKDATGISLLWQDGNYGGLKMGIPSPDFISRFGDTEKDFAGFLKLWREYPKLMKVFIGHCRKSSGTNSYDNKNNHPIQIGNMILAHNGTLTNHEKIFDKLDCNRIGDVDSEAIGHLLNHYTNGGSDPFTLDVVKETTRRIHGTYSVLAMSGNNPYQVAQFRDGRPAEMVLVKPLKMVYIASEKKFLENILFEYNKMGKLFAASSKFPYLKQADVEFKTLIDDSAMVWDLTIPITDKTEMSDLYDWEKTPLRVDKIWSTTTTYTSGNTNTYNSTKKKSTGTEVNANSKEKTGGTSAGDDEDANGLVWSKSLNKYKSQDGIKDTQGYGAVTVDVDTAAITPIDGDDDKMDIKPVDKDQVENLIVTNADVEEVSLKHSQEVVEGLADDAKKNSNKPSGAAESGEEDADSKGTTIEIDMTSDPEALKEAEEFVDSGLVKYESDEEVATDIEASDAAVLRPLPMYALANRIKKFLFKQGFYAGFIAGKAKAKPVVVPDKTKSAEKKIRLMKMVIKIMGACLELRCRGNSSGSVKEMIDSAIEEVYGDTTGVRADVSLAFSVGDLKKIPMLSDIKGRMSKD